ncbi:MAG TPA: hypothetical protein VGG28_30595, partial [Kofleriaceae bacterium]
IASTMTNAGALLGTPHFMPPETAAGEPVDARADLYSLGCILYLLIEDHLPFEGESLPDLLQQHAHSPVPPFQHAPPELGRVIERLLAKTPGQRYASAAAARAALEHALAQDLLPPTVRVSATSLPTKRATKRRWPLFAGAGGAIAVGVAAAIAVGGGGPAMPPAPANVAAPAAEPTATPPAPTPTPTAIPTPAAIAAPAPSPFEPLSTKPATVTKPAPRLVRPSAHTTSKTKPATEPPPPF